MKLFISLFLLLVLSLTVSAQKIRRETGRGFSTTDPAVMTVSNSTTETTLFTDTIRAGRMGTNKELPFEILGVMNSPLLAVPSITIRIKLGSATLTAVNALPVAVSLVNKPFIIRGKIINKGMNAQVVFIEVHQSQTSGVFAGLDSTSTAYAKWTVDTSVDQNFVVTAQFGLLSATTTLTIEYVSIDVS